MNDRFCDLLFVGVARSLRILTASLCLLYKLWLSIKFEKDEYVLALIHITGALRSHINSVNSSDLKNFRHLVNGSTQKELPMITYISHESQRMCL